MPHLSFSPYLKCSGHKVPLPLGFSGLLDSPEGLPRPAPLSWEVGRLKQLELFLAQDVLAIVGFKEQYWRPEGGDMKLEGPEGPSPEFWLQPLLKEASPDHLLAKSHPTPHIFKMYFETSSSSWKRFKCRIKPVFPEALESIFAKSMSMTHLFGCFQQRRISPAESWSPVWASGPQTVSKLLQMPQRMG